MLVAKCTQQVHSFNRTKTTSTHSKNKNRMKVKATKRRVINKLVIPAD